MSTEIHFWHFIQQQMLGAWSAQRHEDKITPGIPDVSFGISGRNGWIELKHLDKYPVRKKTPVRIDHFTREQKAWLTDRYNFGGNCWLLLRIKSTIYLFKADNLNGVGTILTAQQLREQANAIYEGQELFRTWLIRCLTSDV